MHVGDYPDYPKVDYGTGEKTRSIKSGEYLVKAGDCIACHTTAGGAVFAGGLAFKTPFGTIYSANITPDKNTGIGKWNDKDFIRAMREGKSPDGSYYFPVFPYPDFNKMTEQDLLDIKAYLNTIPAVAKENKDPDMPIPFRWRFMQLGWRTLFFTWHRGEFQPDNTKSKAWNRGAYLVQGPGHCGMCHTPLNFLGAPKRKYYLTGGFVDGFYAPNISSAALGKYTLEQIEDVFLHDDRVQGGKIVAKPMLEVNHDSLQYMTKEDLDAIAIYLKSVKSQTPPAPKHSDKVSTATGKKVYNKYCSACHITGAGGSPKIDDLNAWTPRLKTGLNALYKHAIAGLGSMPPKGGCPDCNNAEIQASVDYMVELVTGSPADKAMSELSSKTPEAPSEEKTQKTKKPQKPTLARGKEIYDHVCATCHNDGKLGAPKLGDKEAWQPLIEKNIDVLVYNTIHGYKNNPVRGACNECSDTDIIAAVKYIVQESKTKGDYTLW